MLTRSTLNELPWAGTGIFTVLREVPMSESVMVCVANVESTACNCSSTAKGGDPCSEH
jgi:hypothetical protein